ncbi:MAG: UDP-N-acetylmuramoyl-L-alanyl-D-glutamate--2,6-diaminopimelate ligase, partial [Clostridia bacterium]|nr:UDP-N-acetylmuramoyl-L-alanyl-D-glutamate--2,6-diaminopimelate ligase [Clostridia bacterium]
MLFKDILPEVEGKLAQVNIKGITCNSKEVKEGFIFVCIKGAKTDGHKFAKSALENGAAVLVAEEDTGLPNQIIVEDTHKAYAKMCAAWFENPADSLKLIGVTGTNGKTS